MRVSRRCLEKMLRIFGSSPLRVWCHQGCRDTNPAHSTRWRRNRKPESLRIYRVLAQKGNRLSIIAHCHLDFRDACEGVGMRVIAKLRTGLQSRLVALKGRWIVSHEKRNMPLFSLRSRSKSSNRFSVASCSASSSSERASE